MIVDINVVIGATMEARISRPSPTPVGTTSGTTSILEHALDVPHEGSGGAAGAAKCVSRVDGGTMRINKNSLSFIQIAETDHLFSILILKADLGQVCLFDKQAVEFHKNQILVHDHPLKLVNSTAKKIE